MHQFPVFQKLPFRGLKNRVSFEDAHPAADDHLIIGRQLLYQVGIVEPYHPDVPRLITDYGFGAPSATWHDLTHLPDVGNDGLLIALDQLGDGLSLAVIEVAVGK